MNELPGQGSPPKRNGGANGRRMTFSMSVEWLGVLIFVLVQLGAAVWWASKAQVRIDTVERALAERQLEFREMRATQVQILQELAAIRVRLERADGATQ